MLYDIILYYSGILRDRLELDAHNILLCNAMLTWMSIPNAIGIAGTRTYASSDF